MTDIRVETEIAAPPDVVWADVRHIGSHVEWMGDAESIVFTSDAREGVGTTFDCRTRIGPVRLTDRMEITEWRPGRTMGVRHVGLVEGIGRFTLTPVGGDRTRFSWTETLKFPWWLGGPLGARIGAPLMKMVWRRNLKRLAARFTRT